MSKIISAAGLLLAAGALGRAQPQPDPADDLARRAEAIQPVAAELRWRQLPWLTDLAEGQRLARQERRPLLLWVTGDDPLERC
jgi:hypothetical protein